MTTMMRRQAFRIVTEETDTAAEALGFREEPGGNMYACPWSYDKQGKTASTFYCSIEDLVSKKQLSQHRIEAVRHPSAQGSKA